MRGFVSPDVMVRRPSEHDAWPDAGGLQALIGRGSVSIVTSFVRSRPKRRAACGIQQPHDGREVATRPAVNT